MRRVLGGFFILNLVFCCRAAVIAAEPANTVPVPGVLVPARLFSTRGGLGYAQFCAECHRLDGAGAKGIFPPLSRKTAGAMPNGPAAQTETSSQLFTMPSFGVLSDRELSEILGFVRKSWGNDAVPGVKEFRQNFGNREAEASGVKVPRLANLLAQTKGAQLVRGMRLLTETKSMLPENVGSELNCASCHLEAGAVALASPFTGVYASFPGYSPRAGRVITIEDRINGCFIRSLNGKPLAVDSPDMKAIGAYLKWMKGTGSSKGKVVGRGVGKIDRALRPNVQNGQKVYATQCAACHGKVGQGLIAADGRYIYPPLWGDNSFNIGAGMARTYTAAAFTKNNMPIGLQANFPLGQGGLSDQEAVDVAEYFSHQPRPDFPKKANDWPKGGRPGDARY
ncbi:MAG: c-type cytochrome [Syntrophobacteraceae bacterium]|nr:c-type cytochrome [Syntrophobacteraceae bacterium]